MLSSTFDLAEKPKCSSSKPWVFIRPQLVQGSFSLFALLPKSMPSEVSGCLIRTLQGLNSSIDPGDLDLGRFVLMSMGSDEEKTPSIEITHIMPTHTGIIPVSHHDGAIRCGDHIGRSKPLVTTRSVKNVDNLGVITCPALRYGIRPYDTGSGIAVDDLSLKNLGQKSSFVDHYASG